ncbi:hypothetical protein [Synechococcus sp. UW140]|uniref:lipopolysaccharide biosynthesis protein n=1 Tax=Synechococcus sp. UW140 TaxID=368503 RepID=UPI003137F60D
MKSLKKIATHSIFVQVASKGIGFIANVLFLRFIPPGIIGGFTLLSSTAQSLSSIAHFGTDYNYQVRVCALPKSERGGIQRQFLSWNALFSGLGALLAWPILQPSLKHLGESVWYIALIIGYLFIESYVDVLWEPLLANRNYSQVFQRHLQVALFKVILPFSLGLWLGWIGILIGLLLSSTINAGAAILNLRQLPEANGNPLPLKIFLTGGVQFYLVPFAHQLVFFPALLLIGADQGLQKLSLLKVAQLMVQLVGIFPTALAPILFIESSHGSDEAKTRLIVALEGVILVGLGIFSIYTLLDINLLPRIFGNNYSDAIIPARALLLAAVCNGINQVFQQQAFIGLQLTQISVLQISVLLSIAPFGYILWLPKWGIDGYAWLSLTVAITTTLALTFWDSKKVLRCKENILPCLALLLVLPLAIWEPIMPLSWLMSIGSISILGITIYLRVTGRRSMNRKI